jgi:hypothetical protein
MIKRYVTVFALMGLLFLASPKEAASEGKAGKFGLGFELGDPTGFNAKYWLTNLNAFDFVVGWNSWGRDRNIYSHEACYDGVYYTNHRGECDDWRTDGYGWNQFHFHLDYLLHRFDIIQASIPLPLYYGAGLQYEYRQYWIDDSWVGVRGTFGIAFMPKTIPFDFFFELAPVMYVIPAPDFDVNGGIGARFWF